ncbi:DUF2959 domain-containing protein [Thalassotalea sp. G20_0]|uniref:DUF2959 domain-containing protein n=1 Tax=Thalassotalea sp. G20_0 TaxID=2821093 RepID=UPI001ADCC50E|nr:DUF2959 domain-containing protein [Thalassotalea sp. G20_0]MBO9496336.1 DUF2959 domain-containing protein [Thalassotalea sp. G20_0]
MKTATLKTATLFVATLLLAGCQSTYYSAMEKVGIHKRDIMVDRIEDTQTAQEQAQVQFQSALEQFQSVINFEGGDLEAAYNDLNSEYQDSLTAAERVRDRIASVQNVSDALFDEWEDELNLYKSDSLRRASAQKLKDTRRQYQRMMVSLEKSEQRMQPVLDAFQDQVLYLKHNLNARAISALKGEFNTIKADIDRLISDMQVSIDQSRQFIQALKQP